MVSDLLSKKVQLFGRTLELLELFPVCFNCVVILEAAVCGAGKLHSFRSMQDSLVLAMCACNPCSHFFFFRPFKIICVDFCRLCKTGLVSVQTDFYPFTETDINYIWHYITSHDDIWLNSEVKPSKAVRLFIVCLL